MATTGRVVMATIGGVITTTGGMIIAATEEGVVMENTGLMVMVTTGGGGDGHHKHRDCHSNHTKDGRAQCCYRECSKMQSISWKSAGRDQRRPHEIDLEEC